MKIYTDVIQGSPEWLALRCGKFTSSTFGDLFMKESTKGYQEAINKVVFERISGESPETYSNDFMKRGTELEPIARQSYELETFNKVSTVGFIEHNEWIGGSPDGLIRKDGILEIKCPKWNTLIGYLLEDIIPKDYMYQMQGNLFVSERQWCDFYVWHPKFQPMLRRVERDEKMISEIQEKLKIAIEEVQQRIQKLTGVK
jgi:putative phage-type endonuclease